MARETKKSFHRNLIRLAMQKRSTLDRQDLKELQNLQRASVSMETEVQRSIQYILNYDHKHDRFQPDQMRLYAETVRDMLLSVAAETQKGADNINKILQRL